MVTIRTWWKLAAAIAVALAIAQIAASVLVRTPKMHRYLVGHLQRAFGRPVEVHHFGVQLLPAPSFDAEGITVGEDPAFGNEYFLRAERLTAGLRWTTLLHGRFAFGTFSLTRPSLILVRDSAGRWNLERWLPPAKINQEPGVQNSAIYGPLAIPAGPNHLQKIEFDDGRINFKNGEDKQPFALTAVSGSVEQVTSGRWRLQVQATPWRSGILLQSTGTLSVRGDLAGTSARLQPAEISVHWDNASLSDFFRLLRGQDYGVRGSFALDATAKSVLPADVGAKNGSAGDWKFALHARAARIHRWDLTERPDNPGANLNIDGRWNLFQERSLTADQVSLESSNSNLRGSLAVCDCAVPKVAVNVDSAGIQGSDLLAWYRAFQPNVDSAVAIDQFFTGAMTLGNWPLQVETLAFSSNGGTVRAPGLNSPLRIAPVRGGLEGSKLVVEPVRVSFVAEEVSNKKSSAATIAKHHPAAAPESFVDISMTHDFVAHAGAVTVEGHATELADDLKLATALGRTLNHGWDLTGDAQATLRWDWKERPWHGRWNGQLIITNAELQVAGLNLPIRMDRVHLIWNDGTRVAQISDVQGFGALWSGGISEPPSPDSNGTPAWRFDLHANHLDATELDRWVGPRARPGWLRRLLPSLLGGAPPEAENNLHASDLLRRVKAEGALQIDELSVEKLKLKQVRVEGSLRDLRIDVRAAEALWAGGKVRATMTARFLPRPQYEVSAVLDDVKLAALPLTADFAARVGGAASGTVQMDTHGVGREELLQNLTGNGDISFKSVEFRGLDLAASVTDGASRAGLSRWSAGNGVFQLENRSIILDGLRLDTESERTTIKGKVSFEREADLVVETSAKRSTIPAKAHHVLKVSGPLDGLHFSSEKAIGRELPD